jgi:dTMP kinase
MFITFEGIDYSGKSTQSKLLYQKLSAQNIKCRLFREPGGTRISEKIRKILLDKNLSEMTALTEFMLFSASRSQLVSEVIRPLLRKGWVVICDRYFDSSTAYQAYAGGLDMEKTDLINNFATGGLIPDITFLLDISPEDAFRRSLNTGMGKDRIESKSLDYYRMVRRGFKSIARNNPHRFFVVNGIKSQEYIHSVILKTIKKINQKFNAL